MAASTLDAFLDSHALARDGRAELVEIVRAIANASIKVRNVINQGALGAAFAGTRGGANATGDTQKDLDVHADTVFLDALRGAPVALYGSEELDHPVLLNPAARLAVAIDPLDGSSNIDTNLSIGTIFSVLPVLGDPLAEPDRTFLQPGRVQLAAGFVIYGPQLAIVLTLGSGTHVFVFSTRLGAFVQAYESRTIDRRAHEFAINASNYRHWYEAVRLYIDDCLKGAEGPRERDFNMRWNASLVSEAYRILMRGGVFLYPADQRKGYGHGRLRLVYEANPIAMLVEQAGGSATDTVHDILDLVPEGLHQRTPLVFGAAKEVARIARYHTEPSLIGERSPLFGNRGLFRA
ncbi:MAG: class 1 fructose-bisphosphatase [Mesorhizobium sp.]|nr:class 1 fructose-bisphosphatase [Mesorhizobium sp.]